MENSTIYKSTVQGLGKPPKQDIRSAQIKAAVRVNSELLHLYWQLGAEIIERQKEMTWGSGFLEELSRELMAEFPDMKGFSYRNIRSIKQWYLFYNEPYTIWQQVVSKLGEEKFSPSLGASSLYHLPMQGSG